jgi:hypothetical protein
LRGVKANKVPYRPRSAWERVIIDALEDGRPATLGTILDRVGIRVSPSDREAAVRTLEHMAAEGIIEKRVPVLGDQGWRWRLRRSR